MLSPFLLAVGEILSGSGWVKPTLFQAVVAYSFTFTLVGMVVFTVYSFLTLNEVSPNHKSSVVIGGIITLAASISYTAMRLTYTPGNSFPIEFRYADWLITTPLLLLKFVSMLEYKHVAKSSILTMIVADVCMIVTGFIGLSALQLAPGDEMPRLTWVMFAISMLSWFAVVGVLMGPVRAAIPKVSPLVGNTLKLMLVFPTLLWAPYPIAYVIRCVYGKGGDASDLAQLIENVADFVNKVIFGLITVLAVRAATLAADRRAARKKSNDPAFSPGEAGIDEVDASHAATRKAMNEADAAHGIEAKVQRPLTHL